MMDRFNEMLIGGITVVGGVVAKLFWQRQDRLEERINALEKTVATKDDLLKIDRNIDLIVSHLLDKK